MAGLMESVFDIFYLVFVIAFGIKLLFKREKGAKLFGIMGIVLGSGDAFHLIPRIMAHMMDNGMENLYLQLSYGKMITSLTMTVFYLIYYIYFKKETGFKSRTLNIVIGILTASRVILTLLPQNEWASRTPSFAFAIYRNIPFLIMGTILVYLSYRENSFFKRISYLITISFVCYLPVVLFADKYPLVGMLMIPKTVAYFLIVYKGYEKYKESVSITNILENSLVSLIIGLASGVFYREFSKFYSVNNTNSLTFAHTHVLTLGFLLSVIVYLLLKDTKIDFKRIKAASFIWVAGLTLTVIMMVLKGLYVSLGNGVALFNPKAFAGISGLGHIALSMGLLWMLLIVLKANVNKEMI